MDKKESILKITLYAGVISDKTQHSPLFIVFRNITSVESLLTNGKVSYILWGENEILRIRLIK